MKNLSPRVQARQPCSVGKVTLWVTVTRSLNLSAHSKEQMAEHQAVYATDEVDSRVVLRYLLILCCSMVVHSLSSGSRPKRPAHMVLKRSRSASVVFRSVRVQTSPSRTSWPQRQSPILSAHLLDPEVTLVVVNAKPCPTYLF